MLERRGSDGARPGELTVTGDVRARTVRLTLPAFVRLLPVPAVYAYLVYSRVRRSPWLRNSIAFVAVVLWLRASLARGAALRTASLASSANRFHY